MFIVFDRYNEVSQSFETLEDAKHCLLELRERADRYDYFDVLLLEGKELPYEFEQRIRIKDE
jgi:hypothetical protein